MNEKKNSRARKVLLVGISAVLVAAISVGSTLAYLSAITNTKDNVFTASGDITGRVLEPDWDTDMQNSAAEYVPGRTYDKNPMVDNETSDAKVYVGAKLVFKIDVGNGLKVVDYATFTHFVDLANYAPSPWQEQTVSDDSTSKYYFYTTILTKDAADTADDVVADATDHTVALFTSVTPKKDINIRTGGTATDADVTSSANLQNLVFPKFDFRIQVFAHGVKYCTVNSSTGEQVGSVLSTESDAKAEILAKLKTRS